jgi:hypothetical protein
MLVTGLIPGQIIPVTVGVGGAAGTTAGAVAGPGGTSSFGQFVSATGGSLNSLATTSAPGYGATPPGMGVGGNVNFIGATGPAGIMNQGGLGGAAPIGGNTRNSGIFPGGGASGACTGPSGNSGFNGAPGAGGLVLVR